ncbi:MAG: PRC-barrel domain-containing protein [Candidatus Jordarchaeum sp.]|uniref:PRC-barrel domain-containing protein n=1 Tax=Candidatus Jordarchaeum sp. TaxID=2823881 RepID=UPI0040495F88
MRASLLEGKEVIAPDARIIGHVSGIDVDFSEWKVTHLRVDLSNELVETFGYKKPFFGRLEILIPVEAISNTADVVTLNKTVEELKDIIEKTK